MKNATKKPVKRIYSASTASHVLDVTGPEGESIGTLTVNPNALNAIVWRRTRRHEGNEQTKTLLNLVEWIEAE